MKYFMNKTLLASCSIAAAVFFACGDDTSSNFNDEGSTVLPDTLESFVDLQAYNRLRGRRSVLAGHGCLQPGYPGTPVQLELHQERRVLLRPAVLLGVPDSSFGPGDGYAFHVHLRTRY